MDDLTTFTPCLCAACGRMVLTSGHDCTPTPARSVLESVVLRIKRRRVVESLARRRRGRR
jgi:hypothetical protein